MKYLEQLASLLLLTIIVSLLTKNPLPLLIGLGLFLLGLFIEPAGEALAKIYTGSATLIFDLLTKLCLIVIFYGLLTPLAVLQRTTRQKYSFTGNRIKTQFILRNKEFVPGDFEKPW